MRVQGEGQKIHKFSTAFAVIQWSKFDQWKVKIRFCAQCAQKIDKIVSESSQRGVLSSAHKADPNNLLYLYVNVGPDSDRYNLAEECAQRSVRLF
jgi:hypothetical protein